MFTNIGKGVVWDSEADVILWMSCQKASARCRPIPLDMHTHRRPIETPKCNCFCTVEDIAKHRLSSRRGLQGMKPFLYCLSFIKYLIFDIQICLIWHPSGLHCFQSACSSHSLLDEILIVCWLKSAQHESDLVIGQISKHGQYPLVTITSINGITLVGNRTSSNSMEGNCTSSNSMEGFLMVSN